MKKLIATTLCALTLAISHAKAANYVNNEFVNVLVPAGWTVINVSEPYVYGPFTYIRIYLINDTSGQIAIWKVSLSQP